MNQRVLIVEDQFLIALAMEDAILALGHHVVGIAASRRDVERMAETADIALVDVNLLDGPTGPSIGETLAATGCSVVFMTANPEAVGDGVSGAVGVVSKPVLDDDIVGVINYVAACRDGQHETPPKSLTLFH